MAEIKRRLQIGWANFRKHKVIMMNKNMSIDNKRKVLHMCILPGMLFGCETKEVFRKMRITVRKMKRLMLGVYLKDRKKNTWIRRKTGATDIGEKIWHLCRRNDGRWLQEIVSWYPRLLEETTQELGYQSKNWEMCLKEYGTELTGWKWQET
jgi:hypothetical protein